MSRVMGIQVFLLEVGRGDRLKTFPTVRGVELLFQVGSSLPCIGDVRVLAQGQESPTAELHPLKRVAGGSSPILERIVLPLLDPDLENLPTGILPVMIPSLPAASATDRATHSMQRAIQETREG